MDKIYKVVFAVCLVAWALKAFCTDYTWQEWVIIGVVFLLLGLNLWHNGERKLILTVMAIFAVKGIELQKLFKVAFWIRLVTVAGNILLSVIGIKEDVVTEGLTKFHYFNHITDVVTAHSYGFKHPNHSILYLYCIIMLFLLAYGKKLTKRWQRLAAYVVSTGVMYAGYQVFMGRTAWYAWLAELALLLVYELAVGTKLSRYYTKLLCVAPAIISIAAVVETYYRKLEATPALYIDWTLSGRFEIYANRFHELGAAIIWGVTPRVQMDSAILNLLYNYGILFFLAGVVIYTWCMIRLLKAGDEFACIILASAFLYFLTEEMLLNATINVSLLLFATFWKSMDEKQLRNGTHQ